jgi:hypothetical protein
LFILAFAALSSLLVAQEPNQFTAAIIVTDQTGARIPEARVAVISRESGAERVSRANPQGEALIQLVPGTYTLRVQAMGFKTVVEGGVDVPGTLSKTVELTFEDEPCGDCVPAESIEIPVEYADLAVPIPYVPLVSLEPLKSRPLEHHH